jgi:hypothetical protein
VDHETQYATTGDGVYIAYQVVGEGPVDVAWQSDYLSNVDVIWDTPIYGPPFPGDRLLRAVDPPRPSRYGVVEQERPATEP